MNINNAKIIFKEYMKNYDMSNEYIERKYFHSLRISDLCIDIAVSLQLSEEEIFISGLVGLLHDIGRFEQIKLYNNFNDNKDFDHGERGVKILFEDNLIRNYIEDDKYDDIIKNAITSHNKLSIPGNYIGNILLFTQIVRDADKLDILEIFAKKKTDFDDQETKISDKVLKYFYNEQLIPNKYLKNNIDKYIGKLAYIYDLNFNYSFKIIREKNYINQVINNINTKNYLMKVIFCKINEQLTEYVDKKLEGYHVG